MKILKFISLLTVLSLFSLNSFAEENKNCQSVLKAETGQKLWESWKCKMGKTDDPENPSIGKKIKNLFKKKN